MAEDVRDAVFDHLAQIVSLLARAAAHDGSATVTFQPAAFDLKDAAAYLGIGRTKLHELRAAGKIKTRLVGGRPKYTRKSLDRYLEAQPEG